ncbi:MAG: PAS domain S-box protein, partial [Nitrospirales bacterium]|nr:PAS domain S-box protein [Nitrospirales bacterium]
MDSQNWQRQLRGYADPLLKITLAVLFSLFVFEVTKDLLAPDLTLWQSHAITIIFGTVLAVAASYFFLCKQSVLYQQILEENENYKKSEEELRRNKEWFRSLTEHGSDLITVLDPKGTILYDSPSIERILGYRPIDRQGKSGFDLVHPEDIPGAKSIIARAFQKLGSTHTIEMRVRGQDGRWHVLEATGKTMLDQHGKPCGVINSRDITERKQLEQERERLTRDRLLLLESTGEGIYGVDLEGYCTFINRSGAMMFGYAPQELAGKHIHELVHHTQPDGSQCPGTECNVYAAYRSGRSCRIDHEVFCRKDGTTFPSEYSSHPIIENGVIKGAVAAFRDITERKQLERQARQMSRLAALGQLIGGIAHEMKNPLFILTGR